LYKNTNIFIHKFILGFFLFTELSQEISFIFFLSLNFIFIFNLILNFPFEISKSCSFSGTFLRSINLKLMSSCSLYLNLLRYSLITSWRIAMRDGPPRHSIASLDGQRCLRSKRSLIKFRPVSRGARGDLRVNYRPRSQ